MNGVGRLEQDGESVVAVFYQDRIEKALSREEIEKIRNEQR